MNLRRLAVLIATLFVFGFPLLARGIFEGQGTAQRVDPSKIKFMAISCNNVFGIVSRESISAKIALQKRS